MYGFKLKMQSKKRILVEYIEGFIHNFFEGVSYV